LISPTEYAVIENQATVANDLRERFAGALARNIAANRYATTSHTVENGHDRIVTRPCREVDQLRWQAD